MPEQPTIEEVCAAGMVAGGSTPDRIQKIATAALGANEREDSYNKLIQKLGLPTKLAKKIYHAEEKIQNITRSGQKISYPERLAAYDDIVQEVINAFMFKLLDSQKAKELLTTFTGDQAELFHAFAANETELLKDFKENLPSSVAPRAFLSALRIRGVPRGANYLSVRGTEEEVPRCVQPDSVLVEGSIESPFPSSQVEIMTPQLRYPDQAILVVGPTMPAWADRPLLERLCESGGVNFKKMLMLFLWLPPRLGITKSQFAEELLNSKRDPELVKALFLKNTPGESQSSSAQDESAVREDRGSDCFSRDEISQILNDNIKPLLKCKQWQEKIERELLQLVIDKKSQLPNRYHLNMDELRELGVPKVLQNDPRISIASSFNNEYLVISFRGEKTDTLPPLHLEYHLSRQDDKCGIIDVIRSTEVVFSKGQCRVFIPGTEPVFISIVPVADRIAIRYELAYLCF
jgi:hypothetical protein